MRKNRRAPRLLLLLEIALCCLYFSSGAAASGFIDGRPELTEEERAYVAAHPEISIALDTSWIPYAMISRQSGDVIGTIPNIFDTLCGRLGLNPAHMPKSTYMDALRAVQSGQTMVVSGVADDPEMAKKNGVALTLPYITISYSAVTRDEIADLYSAGADYTVAVCVGSYSTLAMKKKMPSYKFMEYHSNLECMEAVYNGEADMALIAAYSAEYYKGQHRYAQLHSILISNFSWGLCFGVNKNCDPLLVRILNKGIASLSENDVDRAIYKSLMDAVYSGKRLIDYVYDRPLLSMAALVGVLLLLLGCAFLLILQRVKNRELEQERKLNLQLTRANSVKQEFLARMSHELRTPMNAILGSMTLALDLPDRSKEMTAYIEQSRSAGKYLLRIINDILDAHAVESGMMKLEAEWIQPGRILSPALDMIVPEFAKKNVCFIIEHNDKIDQEIEYELDPVRCVQVFENLLNNALKFTPPGGTVTFRHEHVRRYESAAWELFIIKDTGCGMSGEFQKRMFEPFAQERRLGVVSAGGVGLGLSVVRQIVDCMRGSIEVKSAENAGTEIRVLLPFSWRRGKTPLTEVMPDDVFKGKRILVVEDSSLNALIMEKLLQRKNMIPQMAQDGLIALKAFQEAPLNFFDAVLMDIQMPNMNGLESTRAIRALDRPDAKTIPIIAVTANAYESDKEECRRAGMNAHLAKPVDVALLYSTLRNFLAEEEHEQGKAD